jgi:hypothetical protein
MRVGERGDRDTVIFHVQSKIASEKNPRETSAGTLRFLKMRRKTAAGQ